VITYKLLTSRLPGERSLPMARQSFVVPAAKTCAAGRLSQRSAFRTAHLTSALQRTRLQRSDTPRDQWPVGPVELLFLFSEGICASVEQVFFLH